MSSLNKTALGFNEWVETDKPVMEDFNADNALADKLIQQIRIDQEREFAADQQRQDEETRELINLHNASEDPHPYLRAQLSEKVNEEPPQEHDLTVSAGMVSGFKSTYYKTPFKQVFVHLDITNPIGNFSADEVIATLPEGFRPRSNLPTGASVWGGNNTAYASAAAVFGTNGTIKINSATSYNNVRVSFSFLAAQYA